MNIDILMSCSCPLDATIAVIGGKYKLDIIYYLFDRTLRYYEIAKLVKIHKDLEEDNNNLQNQLISIENRKTALESEIKNMRAELYGLKRLKEYSNTISSLISSFNENIKKVTYNEHQNDETAHYRSVYCIEYTSYELQKKVLIGSLSNLVSSKDNT